MENNDSKKIVVKIGKERVHIEFDGLPIEKIWSAGYENLKWFKVGGKIGLTDDMYRVIATPHFETVSNFKNGFAVVSILNLETNFLEYSHLRPTGKLLTAMRYHGCSDFDENGIADVVDDSFRHFWVDSEGHEYPEKPEKTN